MKQNAAHLKELGRESTTLIAIANHCTATLTKWNVARTSKKLEGRPLALCAPLSLASAAVAALACMLVWSPSSSLPYSTASKELAAGFELTGTAPPAMMTKH